MSVIGIDPSLTGTGVVVIEYGKIVEKILIKSKPPEEKSYKKELERILIIVQKIENVIDRQEDVDIAVIEGLSFGARNTTALIQLSGLNYFIRRLLYSLEIPFVIVAPTTLKKFITGKGNGQKDLIMMEIYKRYNVTITNDNEADAYVLARIGDSLIRENKITSFQKEVINLLKKQL